ncbi:hypothetical protein, partial [Streptomyces scabiei]|uniref:hypothetical protein n=1 Tax=Streptomyces scabiei TaxID=1930 RepID=UPI0038F72892
DILMLADLSCTAYSANGRLDYVFVGSANEKIDQHPLLKMFEDTSMQSVNFIKDDPLVHIKKLKDTTDQFDTIYLDTNSNDKHVTTS